MAALKKRKFVFKTLQNAQSVCVCVCGGGGHSAILLTFIKLPFVIKIFVLSMFERPFYTGLTVYSVNMTSHSITRKIVSKKGVNKLKVSANMENTGTPKHSLVTNAISTHV